MAKLTINVASVKVMRSHDYCHFEVNLAASVDCPPDSPEWYQHVDNLRKNAARLADKAVEQYRTAKRANLRLETKSLDLRASADNAERTPEPERTPEEKAAIKAWGDFCFEQRHYDYQDDWDEQDH